MNKLAAYILIFSVALNLDMGLGGSGIGSIAFARKGTDMAKSGDDEVNSRENSMIIKDINIENKFNINVTGSVRKSYSIVWFFYPQNEEEASKIKNRFGGTYPFPLGSKKSGLNEPIEFFISIVATDGKVVFSGNKVTTEIVVQGHKRLGRDILDIGLDPGLYKITIRPTHRIEIENFSMGYELSPY